jgi:hypothetical protein
MIGYQFFLSLSLSISRYLCVCVCVCVCVCLPPSLTEIWKLNNLALLIVTSPNTKRP